MRSNQSDNRATNRLAGVLIALAAAAMVLAGLVSCAPKEEIPAIPADAGALARDGLWQAVPAGPPPNVILITLDTTRRDHLSCYQPSTPPTTPQLDALAAQAILFERAESPAPITLPTHATILTGLYPYAHGARNNGTYVLAPEQVTLAEVLKQRGYATGAVVGAYPVAAEFGLDQGFDSYDDAFPASSVIRGNDAAQRRAEVVTERGLAWARAQGAGPYFLWLHYFDPHAPYDPPEPYRSSFPGDPYRGEIAYTDAQVGRFLDGLRASDR
jgi:arylsulfatase A-like enzyme